MKRLKEKKYKVLLDGEEKKSSFKRVHKKFVGCGIAATMRVLIVCPVEILSDYKDEYCFEHIYKR